MGLIKERCAVCLTPTTKLLSIKLGDGSFVCDNCSSGISDMFKKYYLDSLTIVDFKEYLMQKELEKVFLASEFKKTKSFSIASKELLVVDEKRGVWYIANDGNPDVFCIDQVLDCCLVDLLPRSNGGIHELYPDKASCFTELVIKLKHPYISCVTIPITNTNVATFVQDEAVGNDIVAYFKDANST